MPGAVQTLVLTALRERGSLTPVEAGRVTHAQTKGVEHVAGTERSCCEFCVRDGRRELRRLEAHGLAIRPPRDRAWRPVPGDCQPR